MNHVLSEFTERPMLLLAALVYAAKITLVQFVSLMHKIICVVFSRNSFCWLSSVSYLIFSAFSLMRSIDFHSSQSRQNENRKRASISTSKTSANVGYIVRNWFPAKSKIIEKYFLKTFDLFHFSKQFLFCSLCN